MRVLIIEDDQNLSDVLSLQLQHEGFETDCIYHGADAVFYALQNVYDVIILDRMLPGMDGLTILKLLRENQIHTPVILATALDSIEERITGLNCGADDYIVKPYDIRELIARIYAENQIHTPVILATALDSIEERITGLNCGADDYIVKPYDIRELIARIYALVRRPSNLENIKTLSFGDLVFDLAEGNLSVRERKIHLSKRERLLLEYFLKNPNQTLSRQLLYTRIWGIDGEVEDGNLDTYIYYLRKHLRSLGSHVQISTVHGTGYKLEEKK